jgi:hypothetical protein
MTLMTLITLITLMTPDGTFSSSAKPKIVDQAIEWLRKNSPQVEDLDEPNLLVLAKISGVPLPDLKLTPTKQQRDKSQKFVDDVVSWLQHSDPKSLDLNDSEVQTLTNLTRCQQIVKESLHWIRANEVNQLNMDHKAKKEVLYYDQRYEKGNK